VLDAFLEMNAFDVEAYQAALIPIYDRWKPLYRRFGGGSVYLVGDAAGHVKVSTVGGLVTGFRGAEAVVKAILSGTSRVADKGLRWELSLHLLVRKVLHEFGEEDYCRLLDLTTGRSHRSLGRVTRDEVFKLLLRVAWGQPELFVDALRAVSRRASFHTSASTQSA
jgi:flavin-dependent dehydrogenase